MTIPDIAERTPLLGDLNPCEFMERHWQREPLLIRQALPGWRCPISPAELRKLAADDYVESRLVWHDNTNWHMQEGPFPRLPRATEPNWSALVQGVDLWHDSIAALRDHFRFIPDARLDDVMISLASKGGGVGPHFDSYDVFLLQARGTREWQISRQSDLSLLPDLPLKVLANFQPEQTFVLKPGDMLYLPPHVAHHGIANSADCMTISIGFRSPTQGELARWLLDLAAERSEDDEAAGGELAVRYTDPGQEATLAPAALPKRLCDAALKAAQAVPLTPDLAADALGRWLTRPKHNTHFNLPDDLPLDIEDLELPPDLIDDWPGVVHLRLDRRTRFLYRGKRGYINGEILGPIMNESLKTLADQRACRLGPRPPSARLRALLQDWLDSGWVHTRAETD